MSDTDLRSRIKSDGVDHVYVEFPDLNGTHRSKRVTADYFLEKSDKGFSMQLSLLAVSATDRFAADAGYGEEVNFADGTLKPMPETYKRVPWLEDTARVLCRFEHEGKPVPAYSGTVLERVLEGGEDISFRVGTELEFFLLREEDGDLVPVTDHNRECVTETTEASTAFIDRLDELAAAFDVPIRVFHKEESPGQFEALFDHGPPLEHALDTLDLKRVVKRAASDTGHVATFMPKPVAGKGGSGFHLHVSAIDGGDNALADGDDLSPTGRHFLGGVLEHADALTALSCPTMNSFKRLWSGYFAATTASWGWDNRLAAFRVPGSGTTRLENRIPAADANPLRVVAGTLAAGLHGVEAGIDPGDQVDGDPGDDRPSLPRALPSALEALEQDAAMRSALGGEFIDVFCGVKRAELAAFDDAVTGWERDEYLRSS
jgi:glutamine synthetase